MWNTSEAVREGKKEQQPAHACSAAYRGGPGKLHGLEVKDLFLVQKGRECVEAAVNFVAGTEIAQSLG